MENAAENVPYTGIMDLMVHHLKVRKLITKLLIFPINITTDSPKLSDLYILIAQLSCNRKNRSEK